MRNQERAEQVRREFEVIQRLSQQIEDAVAERDEAQEAMSQAYYLVTGRSPEWSNLFGYEQALEEISVALTMLRAVEAAPAIEATEREE